MASDNKNKKKKIAITDHNDPPAEPAPKKQSKIAVSTPDDEGLLQVPHDDAAPAAAVSTDANPDVAAPIIQKHKTITISVPDEPAETVDGAAVAASAVSDDAERVAEDVAEMVNVMPEQAGAVPEDAAVTPPANSIAVTDETDRPLEPVGPPVLPIDMLTDDGDVKAAGGTQAGAKAVTSIKILEDKAEEDVAEDGSAGVSEVAGNEAAEQTKPLQIVDNTAPDDAAAPDSADPSGGVGASADASSSPLAVAPAEPADASAAPAGPRPSLSTSRPTIVPKPQPDAQVPASEPELPDIFDDMATAHAVEDIVAKEGDELLAVQDRRAPLAEPIIPIRKQRKFSLGSILRKPAVRWALALLVVGGLGVVGAMPQTRYAALNTVGVRAGASVKVVDQSTQQPLKNVHVKLGGATADTDADGVAQFTGLRLGKTTLTIEKRAFAPVTESRTLGWGSNPLGERRVSPVGSQYDIMVTDFLSAKPVASASVTAGDADANADDKGLIKLTMEHSDAATVQATIKAPGYRDEQITIDTGTKQQIDIKLVSERKHVFVSQRSGKYDLYAVDVDGNNEKVVLAGTGRERQDVALAPHPRANVAAFVSTRDDKHNADGYLLSTLSMVNLDNGDAQSVVQSEQISIAGWVGDRLVYVQIVAGASAANPSRQRLMSYDYKTRDNKQLASANYFNDVLVANGKVYYAPSSAYQASNTNGMYRVNADGTNSQTIINQETWNLFRTDYGKITITIPNQWYEFSFDATSAVKLDGQPSNTASRVYMDSPNGKLSAWLDKRDGKGVLLVYDIGTKTDKVLQTQSGLVGPVRWLNDASLTYRIHTEQETADYAMALDGGQPVKIRDVTPTGSVDRWYYY